jgi:hypothetical protein
MISEKSTQAIYEAFLAAGKKLGPKVKGLPSLVRNWKAFAPGTEEKQAA